MDDERGTWKIVRREYDSSTLDGLFSAKNKSLTCRRVIQNTRTEFALIENEDGPVIVIKACNRGFTCHPSRVGSGDADDSMSLQRLL
jgi:hypothetical protein